ncbi:hypothetical protein RIVM261_017750 [Rivularia sp. IAM M-261]|nr:hypothetical protein RIVM261_017750 [Rivularia sp. IAM M-261]
MAIAGYDSDELNVGDLELDTQEPSFKFQNETETILPVAELIKVEGDANQQVQGQQLGQLENSNLKPNIGKTPDESINEAPEYRDFVSSGFNPIRGTPNSETINGTENDDIIAALAGDDKVYGLGGSDAISGGASAQVLASFYGTDNISFEIPSQELPGVSRSFGSFTQAANEDAISRIYGGIHINAATVDGVQVGKNVGDYVVDNFLT